MFIFKDETATLHVMLRTVATMLTLYIIDNVEGAVVWVLCVLLLVAALMNGRAIYIISTIETPAALRKNLSRLTFTFAFLLHALGLVAVCISVLAGDGITYPVRVIVGVTMLLFVGQAWLDALVLNHNKPK